MTGLTDIFAGCLRARSFAGGRSPGRYCADLRSGTLPHQKLARASSWIQALSHALPFLSSTPDYSLLGALADGLLQPPRERAALAARRAQQGDISGVPGRRSRAETRAPNGRNAFRSARNSTDIETFRRMTEASGPQLVPSFPLSTIDLGQTDAFAGASDANAASAMRARRSSALPHPSVMQEATSKLGTLSGVLSEAAVRDWQDRIVCRAVTRLRSAASADANNVDYFDGVATVEEVTPATGSQWLQKSWSRLVNGQSATADMLAWAANLQLGLPFEQTGIPQPEFAPRRSDMQPATGTLQTTALHPDLVSAGGRPPSTPAPDAHMGRQNAGEPWLQPATTTARELAEELLSHAHDEIWIPSPGTSMRTSTSQQPGPASTRLAGAEVPLLHRQERDAAEDLSEFAGKLKRVLDEEARRYGIDV